MPALAFAADPTESHFMNRGWLEYTGLNADEASKSGWEKTIHADDFKPHHQSVAHVSGDWPTAGL